MTVGPTLSSRLFYDFELSMQIYARQDAKQHLEPEVPLLFSLFFEAALNHCKSALASAPFKLPQQLQMQSLPKPAHRPASLLALGL